MRAAPVTVCEFTLAEQEVMLENDQLLVALAASSNLNHGVQERLVEQLAVDSEWAPYLASNPSASPDSQKALLDLGDGTIWRHLAINPSITPPVQLALLELGAVSLLRSRVLHREVQLRVLEGSEAELVILARTPAPLDPDVEEALLRYPHLSVHLPFVQRLEDAGLPVLTPERPAHLHQSTLRGTELALDLVAELGGDVEAAAALLPTWRGSIQDLVEASLLVRV